MFSPMTIMASDSSGVFYRVTDWFSYFFLTNFYCHIVDLQSLASFCYTAKVSYALCRHFLYCFYPA